MKNVLKVLGLAVALAAGTFTAKTLLADATDIGGGQGIVQRAAKIDSYTMTGVPAKVLGNTRSNVVYYIPITPKATGVAIWTSFASTNAAALSNLTVGADISYGPIASQGVTPLFTTNSTPLLTHSVAGYGTALVRDYWFIDKSNYNGAAYITITLTNSSVTNTYFISNMTYSFGQPIATQTQ